MTLDDKLQAIGTKLDHREPVKIMIIGLGSVGCYLLDYLIGLEDSRIEIVVAGRDSDKLTSSVNIIRTAATIRCALRSKVTVDAICDLERVESIAELLARHQPDVVVNSSRVYSGLKYGSISWHNLRAYGIWTPLSMRYPRNIMQGYEQAQSKAVVINTSYSDAVIPWLKSAGTAYPDFGSGNLNHLIPRIKFAVADLFSISDLNEIEVTLATSHFHDVVVSKEGITEGCDVPLDIRHNGRPLSIDPAEIFARCAIAMPTDSKRNMMNASSNFQIVKALLTALAYKKTIQIHSPGVGGQLGGYPFLIDGQSRTGQFDTRVFSMTDMQRANRASIALDGIENVENGALFYTDSLIKKVRTTFGVELPKQVKYDEIDRAADFIIDSIIKPNIA